MSRVTDIAELVLDMGYILAIPKGTPTPSYYKLGDGTILSALIKVNHILIDASESGGGAINHSVEIHTFSPNRSKLHKPIPQKQPLNIIDQDVACTTIKEEFNDYLVGKDIIVSAKAVVGQIAKTDAYSNEGEPVYNINVQPVIKVVDKRRTPFAPDMR